MVSGSKTDPSDYKETFCWVNQRIGDRIEKGKTLTLGFEKSVNADSTFYDVKKNDYTALSL